jgi:hypothetical protein
MTPLERPSASFGLRVFWRSSTRRVLIGILGCESFDSRSHGPGVLFLSERPFIRGAHDRPSLAES